MDEERYQRYVYMQAAGVMAVQVGEEGNNNVTFKKLILRCGPYFSIQYWMCVVCTRIYMYMHMHM